MICSSASCLVGESLAVTNTLCDGGVPHARGVGIAGRLVEVLVRAGDLATLARKVAEGVGAVGFGERFTAGGSAVAAAVTGAVR